MRILCLGDLHLGAGADLGVAPYGPDSRLADQRKVLLRIANLAADEGCELVLFAGDAFHRRRPTPSEILTWRRFLDALHDNGGIPVIAIDGNHDVETADRPSALETVRTSANYEVARRPRVHLPFGGSTVIRPGTPVVASLPWTPPARLVASMNGSVPRDEVNAVAAELLIASARELREEIPEGAVAILLAHWSVSGSSLPNGLPVDQLREPVLPLADLEALGFDCVVLGHIHKGQVLAAGNPIFYTGSPAVVDFGEASVPHGVWIIDTERPDGEAVRFHPIADRPFLTVDVDLTTERHLELGIDETDSLAAGIAAQFPVEEAVMRIRYKATPEQARRADVAAIKQLCANAGCHKVYRIEAEIVRGDRVRVEGVDENLEPLEALYEWTKANEVPHDRAEALGELTARYLQEAAT